jgi:hypothetical protein
MNKSHPEFVIHVEKLSGNILPFLLKCVKACNGRSGFAKARHGMLSQQLRIIEESFQTSCIYVIICIDIWLGAS